MHVESAVWNSKISLAIEILFFLFLGQPDESVTGTKSRTTENPVVYERKHSMKMGICLFKSFRTSTGCATR
jgi:hypothetical protein